MSSSHTSLVSDPLRLAALDDYAILDTPAEPGFDDIVHLTCRICAVPVALVSLVAGDRQWFKARIGFPPCETDLDSSVCAHALAHPDRLLIIPDLTVDPRTSANPLVTGEPFIRFYAGAPLVTPEGQVLGSLCAIDVKPRPEGLSAAQAEDLLALARQVMTQLELRRAVVLRDHARAAEANVYRMRDVLRETQTAIATAEDDLPEVLRIVVAGALQAIPAAEGGTVELIDGASLVYHASQGTLLAHEGLRVPLNDSLAGRCAATHTPFRMADTWTDPHVNRAIAETLKLRSAIITPVLRGETLLGLLKLQSSQQGAFTDRDLQVLGLFAGSTTIGFTEATARADLRARDIYWRGLFDRLSEGFLVGEVIRDIDGRGVDWRTIEVNPAWGTMLDIDASTVLGRSVREVMPDVEEAWIDEFVQVVDTGQPTSFLRDLGALQRCFEGRAFSLGGNHFGVIFLEVTARVQVERRRAALLQLGDRLRDLTTVPEMTRAASEIVGRTLGASRAGFGRLDGDVEHITIEPDWTAPGIASISGRHRFADYGDIRLHLQRGDALVVDDVRTDPRTRDDTLAWQAIGAGALVNMPVRERGRTVAVFIAHDVNARTWTPDELAFLRNVADRVEVGVARVRAEDIQVVLNRELSHRLKNTLSIVQSMARQTLREVSERELVQSFENRVLALSHAHDALLEKSWLAAKMREIMESVLTLQADLDRFTLDGPDLDINSEAALSLSLLLHELATNALKYGALSADEGRIRIAWRMEDGDSPALVLDWQETGGPTVAAPNNRGGFGSKLIRMGLVGTRKANLDYHPSGLRAEFRAPLATIQVQVH